MGADAGTEVETEVGASQTSPATPAISRQDLRGQAPPMMDALTQERQSLLELQKSQQQFADGVLHQADNLANGAKLQINSDRKSLQEMGIIDRIYGTRGAMMDQLKRDEQTAVDRARHADGLREDLKRSQELSREAQKLLDDAAKMEAAGNHNDAEATQAKAKDLIEKSVSCLSGKAIDVAKEKEAVQQLRELSDQLGRISDHLSTSITVAQYTQEGCNLVVVVGATCVGGPQAGAAVNFALKSAENAIENGADVWVGNKTKEEALADALHKEGGIAFESAIMLVSAGAAKGGNLFITKGAGLATKVAVGAGTGLVIGTGTQAASIAFQMHEARVQFDKKYGSLPPAQREQAWQEFRDANGLSNASIAWKITVSGITNAVSGGSSAAIGHASQAAMNKAQNTVAEKLVTAGGGRAQTYVVNVGSNILGMAATGNLNAQNVAGAMAWGTLALKGGGHAEADEEQSVDTKRSPELEGFHKVGVKIGNEIEPEVLESMDRNLTPEIVRAEGTQAGQKTVAAIESKAFSSGPETVTPKFVEDTSAANVRESTATLLRKAEVPRIVEQGTTKWLNRLSNGSASKISEELDIPADTVRGMQKMLRSPLNDAVIKDTLTDGITQTLHEPVRAKLLELGFKDAFMTTVDTGMKEVNVKLAASGRQTIDQKMVHEAADRGFEKGLYQGVEDVVREGVESAFQKFRRPAWTSRRAAEMRPDALNSTRKEYGTLLVGAIAHIAADSTVILHPHHARKREDGTWEGD